MPLALISETQNIPAKFLTVILSEMSREGIVQSFRGRDGGYKLALPPVDISYGDIVRLTRGSLALVPCASRYAHEKCKNCVAEADCRLRSLMLQPKVLLSDEVDAGLDPDSSDKVGAMLQNAATHTGMAVLRVRHRNSDGRASRILSLAHGRLSRQEME